MEPAAPAGARRLDSESATQLFERVLEALGLGYEHDTVHRHVARALRDEGASDVEVVEAVAPKLGLEVDRLPLPAAEIPREVGVDHPVVGLGATPEAEPWLLLVDARGRRARVAREADPGFAWMSTDALVEALGAPSADAPVTWLAVDPVSRFSPRAEAPSPTPLDRVWALARAQREDLKTVLIYAMVTAALTLTIPIAVQALVNSVAFGMVPQALLVMTVVVLVVLGTSAVLRALEEYVVEQIQRRTMLQVVGELGHRLPRTNRSAFGHYFGPELANRFFDVFTVHKSTALLLIDGLDLILRASAGLLLLAFYHPYLLVFDILLLLAFLFILFVLGRWGGKTAIAESKTKYQLAEWFEELARHPEAFHSPSGTAFARDRADGLLRKYLVAREGHFKVLFRQLAAGLALYAVASGLLLGLGGWLVIRGQLTLGQLVAAELVVTTVLASFTKLGKHLEAYYDLLAAMDKLGQLFDLPTTRLGGDHPPEDGPIELRARDLQVDDEEGRALLQGIDLELAPGEAVAVLGGAATGKSAFAAAVQGHVAPVEGRVEVGGVDLRDLDLAELQGQVAVARGPEILHRSVFDNVRMGNGDLDTAEVRGALEAVGLLEAVMHLPERLDTPLLPSGAPLSEAQARLLMVARALAARPRLLIVDGTLDGLDDATRGPALSALLAPSRPWTLLVLTRRAALARRCDRAVRIEGGAMVPMEAPA